MDFLKFSLNVWMDRMTESEPMLSTACCAGHGPYGPIGKFWVIGIIYNWKFNVPIKAGHSPSHSTDFNWLQLLPPTGVRSFIYRAPERLEPRLSLLVPGVQHSNNWATGRAHSHYCILPNWTQAPAQCINPKMTHKNQSNKWCINYYSVFIDWHVTFKVLIFLLTTSITTWFSCWCKEFKWWNT